MTERISDSHASGPTARKDIAAFAHNPLDWLLRASRGGPHAIVRSSGPVLSRNRAASATVALFGSEAVRAVLSDIETFGMPMSVSVRHELPQPLMNLNSGLFSMTGEHHRGRQRLLAHMLGSGFAVEQAAAVDRGIHAFLQDLPDGDIRLVDTMRRLARLVAEEVLLGSTGPEAPTGLEIQRYFDERRRYASPAGRRDGERLDALLAQGSRVDTLLRERVRVLRSDPSTAGASVVGQLCRHAENPELGLTEDELVAHANVLFMSSSEPIATAMTWILLVLSQHPGLRAALRREAEAHPGSNPPLLAGTVHEVLRLVPPSAILVRVTSGGARVANLPLPPACEVILCPYAEHRSPQAFPEPDRLRPERWVGSRPDLYQFLPFGGGARPCLGRRIALLTLERATQAILQQADPLLAHPQRLDWRINVTLLPFPDPVIRLAKPGPQPVAGDAFTGPAAELLPLG